MEYLRCLVCENEEPDIYLIYFLSHSYIGINFMKVEMK